MTAVGQACQRAGKAVNREDLLTATQRLLDRVVFICYCEDSPEQLLPRETLKSVTEGARVLPGSSEGKVYTHLKALFSEIDDSSVRADEHRSLR